ncbi:MAG TPA: M15 family metallopeptidase [Candidatus Paceibacterota bacterium]|nr:M15 family metallopeptidase [Candidatus Paceibacterota bacterium]
MKSTLLKTLIGVAGIAIFGVLGFAGFQYMQISNELARVNSEKESASLQGVKQSMNYRESIAHLEDAVKQKDAYITFLEGENADLTKSLADERGKSQDFEQQVSVIGKTIAEIQKLQNTDAELLKKYSKIYFLNENYKPAALNTIPSDALVEPKKIIEIHAKVLPFLKAMIDASNATNTPVRIISGFRSFDEQRTLKTTYRVTYGAGANKFSADQGYSEHQLGTTVDISTEKLGLSYTQFAETKAFQWMLAHAHEFGFILSYPKGNTSYQYEPWHWRFVGVALATDLHNKNMHFYDMDQRAIDTYLIRLFDDLP